MESSPGVKVISLVQTVVNRALAKGCRSGAFYSVVEDVVHKYVPEAPSTDAVSAKPVVPSFFTLFEARFVKHEVEKSFLDEAKMKKRFLSQRRQLR